jgi:hypothetical protein
MKLVSTKKEGFQIWALVSSNNLLIGTFFSLELARTKALEIAAADKSECACSKCLTIRKAA